METSVHYAYQLEVIPHILERVRIFFIMRLCLARESTKIHVDEA